MIHDRKARIRKGTLYTALAVAGVGAYAWFNGDPHTSRASGPDGYVLYGIKPDTAQLVRYDFTSGSLSTVGTIQDAALNTLTGIEGSAYFPGFSNIFGFWTDPSDDLTKLVYISAVTGKGVVVGSDLGPERITGACGVNPNSTTYQVYALQESDVIPFDIDQPDSGTTSGDVVPNDPTAARVSVLGAAITYGGQYDVPVTVRVKAGGSSYDPWGNASLPVDANVNDANNPRAYILPSDVVANTQISVGAKAWVKTDSGYDGSQNSHWTTHMAVDSSTATNNVITLRNGDPVPQINGFMDQAAVPDYLQDYIDHANDTMLLGESQAIYLFELGSSVSVNPVTQPGSLSASQDFQDLVVLVTMAPESQELVTGTIESGVISGSMNINPNNSPHNIFELTKPDDSMITRDDLQNATANDLDTNGVYYDGSAKEIRVKAKGNGAQNGITIDGQPYTLKNNTTYTFTAPNMSVSVYNTAASGPWETVRDEFNAVSYSNNDGTENWTSNWGPDTSAASGTRRIESGRMRLDNTDGDIATGEYLERSTDLSGATSATFTFDYEGYGWGGQDTFAIEVSDDGGASWTQIESINVVSMGYMVADPYSDQDGATTMMYAPVTGSRSYQLENHISLTSNVKIRFILLQGFGSTDQYISFDNVQIEHNGGGDPTTSVPMGHWWIDINTTGDMVDGHPGDDPTKASQLILVDQRTGDFTPIMQLSQPYTGLASQDGQTFYAVSGKKVYKIDTAAGTETMLNAQIIGDFQGMGFAGATLQTFGSVTDRVYELHQTTGTTNGTGVGMGITDLKTIVFTPASKDPGRGNFD